MTRSWTFLAALTSAAVWSAVGTLAAQHTHPQSADPLTHKAAARQEASSKGEAQIKVGKTGEVGFDGETVVGELRLKPGRYRFQHRVDGDQHFVHFTEMTKPLPSGGGSTATKAQPVEVKCRLEALDKKVSTTAIHAVREGDVRRVTKILIAGENVAHVF